MVSIPLPNSESDRIRLVPLAEAAKQTPYTAAFLRQLARENKLKAVKFGRDWAVSTDDLRSFLRQQRSRHEDMLLQLRHAEGGLL